MTLLNSEPEMVLDVADDALGRLGYLVIDHSVKQVSSGGIRYSADVSLPELKQLAQAMTYKWAFLNWPIGGAKAGIYLEPHPGLTRLEIMTAFGRAIAPLVQDHAYLPGIDLGTTLDDLRAVMQGAGCPLPEEQIDGSFGTALTVFETIRQMAISEGLQLKGLRVAMEGFGKVGSYLGELLDGVGAVLVGLSTVAGALIQPDGLDLGELLRLRAAFGDELVNQYTLRAEWAPAEALYFVDCDLLIPGARTQVLTADNQARVRARWIVPVANAALTCEAEALLLARGVWLVPDFVANCGGVLASAMLSQRFNIEEVRELIERYYARVLRALFSVARTSGRPVSMVARETAWANHLALNLPRKPLALSERLKKIPSMGIEGLVGRVGWRLHQAGRKDAFSTSKAVRSGALWYYADFTIGQTLLRLNDSGKKRIKA